MRDLGYHSARGTFQKCSLHVSIMFEVIFDRSSGMIRPCSMFVWTVLKIFLTVLEVCFDRSRGRFRPCSRLFRPTSRYNSTVLEV